MEAKTNLRGPDNAHGGAERLSTSIARLVRVMCRGQQGGALVEFAMVLPMMLIITTGIMMFGIAMNNYLALTNAVSIGARTVAVNAGMTLDPCSVASTAIINASPALKSSSFKFAYTFTSTTTSASSSGTSCTGMAANLASGSTVTVTATYPLNLSIFGTKYTTSTSVLSATSTEMVQ